MARNRENLVPVALRHRVLLVGINYHPELTGIGPYTTGLADYLAGEGHEVTVITGMPHYPQWEIDAAYRRRFRTRERHDGVDVRRVRHYTPSQQSALGRGLYELSFFLQSIATGRLRNPDCVIGVVPSLSGGAAAAVLARRYRTSLGLIFQDLVGQAAAQSGIPGGGLASCPVRAIEAWTARQADHIAVVAEAFRPHLAALGVDPARIVHLPNWSHVGRPARPADEVRESLGWALDRPVVLHAGNMGYKQDLGNLVSVARLAANSAPQMRFVLMGDGSDRRRLEALGADLANLVFLDPQPREMFMDVLGAADVLLLNERSTVLDMSLPSKITSYFCSGRPLVAAVPAGGATSDELSRSGGALVVRPGDPPALLRAIELVIDDPDLSTSLVRRAMSYAENNLDESKLLEQAGELVNTLTMSRADWADAK